jgi:putative proteasome-type protease
MAMTYCVGMLLDTGLVFVSDSRTNAGVDQINTFRKTAVLERAGDRVIVLQFAGNLAITQAVMAILRERVEKPGPQPNVFTCTSFFQVAACVGDAIREVHQRDAESLKAFGVDFNVAIIVGGQIAGESPRLFSVYAAGNFVEATPETTYFQIGESKYGKPILDRVLSRTSSIAVAAKCALVSMDSTIRSNLSVGMPLDLVVVRRDEIKVARHMSIEANNAYFELIRNRWSEALREAFAVLPDPDWF